jgi:TctA family transporter
MAAAALNALTLILEPMRLLMLAAGVVFGLSIGVIPGLGGVVGLAILIPFTYNLDGVSAFALLLGMAATTTVSDLIPAVLFGVPGTVGAAATVLDGYPLARAGQAGRAFGAGYAASLFGGLFGAVLLGLTVPLLRPIVLYLASPELLSFCIFGLSMVAVLSGRTPLKGLTAACLGLMLAMVGSGSPSGTQRWTFDTLYLWDHLPLVPVTLGLFAIPELADLAIARSSIARDPIAADFSLASQWQGMRDAARHWWLVLRCSWLGAILGAVPGLGSASIDWIAYGHAARTERDTESFGEGDIRGVIAAESSNNAKEGGHLVPTIAFGVPAGASMALLLSAFLIHGFVPGPEMLTKHLDITYSIIWSLTIAHILGAGICLSASGLFARLAMVRVGVLLPLVMAIVFVGAFEGSQSWGDLYTVVLFGTLGWIMKRLNWPRPPMILGFVLGAIFERYFFISTEIYGAAWAVRPIVVLVLAAAAWAIWRPLLLSIRGTVATLMQLRIGSARFDRSAAFTTAVIIAVLAALWLGRDWPAEAKLVPHAAAFAALVFAALNLLTELFGGADPAAIARAKALIETKAKPPASPEAAIPPALLRSRALRYFAWLAGFLALAAAIGFLPAIWCFVLLLARCEFGERWGAALISSSAMAAALWLVFGRLVAVPWPPSLLGDLLPVLREATGLV